MKVAFGLKAHSGWAALVVLGESGGRLQVAERLRIELVESADASWAKQPYHAAEEIAGAKDRGLVMGDAESAHRLAVRELTKGDAGSAHRLAVRELTKGNPESAHRLAGELVRKGIASARRVAAAELRAAVRRARAAGREVVACAVLTGDPMPAWSVDEILAVHFRMHKAEGHLFRDALARGAVAAGLRLVRVPEKTLDQHAERTLEARAASLRRTIAALGKSAGPPWGRDQKDAALAALIALKG